MSSWPTALLHELEASHGILPTEGGHKLPSQLAPRRTAPPGQDRAHAKLPALPPLPPAVGRLQRKAASQTLPRQQDARSAELCQGEAPQFRAAHRGASDHSREQHREAPSAAAAPPPIRAQETPAPYAVLSLSGFGEPAQGAVPIEIPVAPAMRAFPALCAPADVLKLGQVADIAGSAHGPLAAAKRHLLLRSFSGQGEGTPKPAFSLNRTPVVRPRARFRAEQLCQIIIGRRLDLTILCQI